LGGFITGDRPEFPIYSIVPKHDMSGVIAFSFVEPNIMQAQRFATIEMKAFEVATSLAHTTNPALAFEPDPLAKPAAVLSAILTKS
jgi:hypothetical protein